MKMHMKKNHSCILEMIEVPKCGQTLQQKFQNDGKKVRVGDLTATFRKRRRWNQKLDKNLRPCLILMKMLNLNNIKTFDWPVEF